MSNDRYERIRKALEGLRERCAQEAERITARRRAVAAMTNNEAVKPCKVAAAIRKIDVQQYYECAAREIKALRAERDALKAEIEELQSVCAEAYQVVGLLLDKQGLFQSEKAEKIMDNLSQFRKVHDDVLPWPEVEAVCGRVRQVQEGRPMKGREMQRAIREALSRAHQTAMEQTLRARVPECAEFAGIAQDLDFVVAALRERLG